MVSEFAVLIEHPNFSKRDERLIFGEGAFVRLPRTATMIDVLVAAGIFPSKSQARKNWKGETTIGIGITEFTAGKLRTEIFIHKPPDDLPPDEEDAMSSAS